MRRLLFPLLIAVAAGALSGCDPAPSTPLAPEHKMLDVGKMSPDQVDKMLKGNGPPDRK